MGMGRTRLISDSEEEEDIILNCLIGPVDGV